jgi:hypothetical protein
MKKINKDKEFNRIEFDKYFIKNDDLTITSCCKKKWYKTKKNMKCSSCKKTVTKDIVARGIMQGINEMMKKNEKIKNITSSKTSDDKSRHLEEKTLRS